MREVGRREHGRGRDGGKERERTEKGREGGRDERKRETEGKEREEAETGVLYVLGGIICTCIQLCSQQDPLLRCIKDWVQ